MTHWEGNHLILAEEPDGECELCGLVMDLRPYGPHGENICIDCGEKEDSDVLDARIVNYLMRERPSK